MTIPTENRRVVAWAQIGLSVLFIAGYFTTLSLFLTGNIKIPTEWKDVIVPLIGVLTASVIQIMGYWFARQRENN